MTCRNRFFVLTFIFILFSFQVSAQTPEGARRQMEQGNYSNAVKLYSALNELNHGSFKTELSNAKKCASLLQSAHKSFERERFTEAIGYYNQIRAINPSDQSIMSEIRKCEVARDNYLENEFSKCKTIDDYRAFAQRYPQAKQTAEASRIIKNQELKDQDEASWKRDDRGGKGTIESYSYYLRTANSAASHKKEAYRNRARLYCRTREYSKALSDYDMAILLKCYLTTEDSRNYVICSAETQYASLVKNPSSASVSAYLKWAESYNYIDVISPHLHLNEVRGLLVMAYCREGYYTSAKSTVDSNYPNLSTINVTNSYDNWKKNDWYRYIKQSEKNAKRGKSSNHVRTNAKQPIGLMGGVGIAFNPSGFGPDDYLGVNASFSVGTFENFFNWEISAIPNFRIQYEYSDADNKKFLCPITTGPRFNVFKQREVFFLSLQPEVGYCIGATGVYGGKAIIGFSMVGISIEYLGTMKPMSAGTKWESNTLYGGIGVNLYF